MACRRRRAPISTRTSASSTLARNGLSRDPAQGADQLRSGPPSRARRSQRRNWVLGEMARNGFITAAQRDAAAAPAARHGARRPASSVRNVGGYFIEEVRRQLIARYGEQADDGPNSVYAGGLWVRTSLDPRDAARGRDGAARRPDPLRRAARGWRDPGLTDRRRRRLARRSSPSRRSASAMPTGARRGARARRAARRRSASPTAAPARCPLGAPDAEARHRRLGVRRAAPRRDHRGRAARAAPGRCARSPKCRAAWSSRRSRTGRVLAMQGGFDVRG